MRRPRPVRKNALVRSARPSTPTATKPPEPAVLQGRLAFALYAIGMIGGLGTITALIERAAP